jgi:hypothetical protein
MTGVKKIHHDYYMMVKHFLNTYTSIHQWIYLILYINDNQYHTNMYISLYIFIELLIDVVKNMQVNYKYHKV